MQTRRQRAPRLTGHETAKFDVPPIVDDVLRSSGQPLERKTRERMESSFGHDFSRVRVHSDARAAKSADTVGAHAYTVGEHIAFGKGSIEPGLLAHELTHVVEQSSGNISLQRKAKTPPKDPLCDTFDFDAAKKAVDAAAAAFKSGPKPAQRQALVRALKPIRRCATAAQQQSVHADIADAIWAEAGTPFGGYTGMYPGYAPDMKRELGKLGAKEAVAYGAFALPSSTHAASSKQAAEAEKGDLAKTDIIYFRGHQYAQFLAPGVFTNVETSQGFDLRYIQKAGGLPNVKLMISTSCATLCKEAFEIFHALFPNALLLGYRKAAPLQGGVVRRVFAAQLQSLQRGLLLDQAADLGAITAAWKATVASVHAGDKGLSPAYYDGSLNYWNGKAWQPVDANSNANKCEVHGDDRSIFPAPK